MFVLTLFFLVVTIVWVIWVWPQQDAVAGRTGTEPAARDDDRHPLVVPPETGTADA
jgi:hypothetical protein